MIPLIELYRPINEVTGQHRELNDFPMEVQVAWDKFSQEAGIDHASFIERSGQIYANTKGKGWFEWNGATWRSVEKPGPKLGAEPGRFRTRNWRDPGQWNDPNRRSATLYDVFSTDFAGYRNNLNMGATKVFGKHWDKTIDGAYGPGSVDRMLSELWRRFWTDHEALGEIGHYFDASMQADGDGAPAYNLNIGPRYDVPRNYEGNPWDHQGNARDQRVTSSEYFTEIWSSS